MAGRRDVGDQIDFALRRHFSAVFTQEERDALVPLIRAWDEANPGLEGADRVQAWLAIAREARSRSLVS